MKTSNKVTLTPRPYPIARRLVVDTNSVFLCSGGCARAVRMCVCVRRAYRIGRYCPLCERSFIGPKGTMQLVICKLCDRQLHQGTSYHARDVARHLCLIGRTKTVFFVQRHLLKSIQFDVLTSHIS